MKTLSLFLLIVCGGVGAVRAADVSLYAITQSQSFEQTSIAAPAPTATGGFTFLAAISQTSAGSVISAPPPTLLLPNTTVKPFGPVPGYGPFALVEAFDTQTAMDAASVVWSPDFASVGWTRLFLVTAGAATETRSDIPGSGVTSRFYRLQEP